MHPGRAAALCVALALGACEQPYNPPPSVFQPQPLFAFTPLDTPPPPPPPAPPAPAQGRYIGVSSVAYAGIDRFCNPLTMTNFTVEGTTLRFGHFIGEIRPDGAVYMQAGPNYINGHFIGSTFKGYYWSPPPNCTFTLVFNPETTG